MKIFVFCTFLILSGIVAEGQTSLTGQSADYVYQYGIDLLAHQQYGAARQVFAKFKSDFPTDARTPDAAYFAAFCAVNLYHNDGEKQMAQFIVLNPTHTKATTANFDLALLFYQQKNYNKAIEYFGKAEFRLLTKEQQNIGRFRWGYSYFNQKKLSEALDQFNFIKSQGGNYGPASSYYAGFIEFTNKDYANALIDLKRAELNAAYASVVPNLIAQTLYRQSKFNEVVSYYNTVKSRDGVNQLDEIALLAAEVSFKSGDYANALAGYQEFLDGKKSGDRNIYYRAGFSAMKMNQDAQAIDYLKSSAFGSDTLSYYSSYFLGSLYLKTNQKQQALTSFDVARQMKGNAALAEESNFQFAKIAYDLGRSDLAITELEKFVATYPSSDRLTEVKEILSHAYINANNYNKAIEYLESLTRRGPNLDRAYQKATFLKGTEWFNKENYAQAIAQFEKSILFPLDPAIATEAHYWCAEAYSIEKKYEQAIDHYSAIISPASASSSNLVHLSRYGLGYAYYNLKQYDRALYNFKEYVIKSAREDANVADAQLRLADCYYVAKSYPEALLEYKKVFTTNSPDKDYAHLQVGIILGIQRKYAEAANELSQVSNNYPQSAHKDEALFRFAQLDFEQGKYAQAAAGFTKVLATNPSSRFVPYAYMRRAAANYNLKEYTKTVDDYVSVVSNYPTHPIVKDVLVPLQEALGLAGRSGEFEQYLAKFKNANPDAKGIESIEFETASNLFFNQEYERAIRSYDGFLLAYPQSPRVDEAKYYQAEAYYRLKNYDKALENFYVLEPENTFKLIGKVVARIAELEFKKGKYELAVVHFTKLEQLSANKKDQFTAWSGLLESHYLLANYDSADRFARLILEQGNVNPGAMNKAALYLGKTAMARGDYETAKDEFLHTLNAAQDEYGAEAKYLIGEIQYLNKEYKASIETLFTLVNDFAAYDEWVGRAFLLLADDYLGMNDKFQAQATLKSIIDNNFPLEHIRNAATDKLRKLDEEITNQEAISKDSTDNK